MMFFNRLKSAGAVLVAKLVSGSLAYDDVWFGGRTRNPWNIEEFSTGSSAGPAASTSAGTFQLSFVNACTFIFVFLSLPSRSMHILDHL
jgi:Asp-tRNA(Asn)/Glu-tRNA(Gln) amidotransferase A subunit family amidase